MKPEIEHALKREAVEWVTSDQPDWWYNCSDKEAAEYFDKVHAAAFGKAVMTEDEERDAKAFTPTEFVQNSYYDWWDALPEAYDCLKTGADIALRHTKGA